MPLDAPLAWHGVLAPEDEWSGDGRRFAAGALRNRDLPLPLTWQKASSDGHNTSVVIGRIDSIERVDGMMRGEGTFVDTPETDEFVGLLAEFGKFGVSVDADDSEFEFDEESGQVTFTSARIASACCVAIPAFSSAFITFGTWADEMAAPPFPPKKADVPVDDTAPVEEECDPNAPDYEDCLARKAQDQAPADDMIPSLAESDGYSLATAGPLVEMISDAAWDGSAGRFSPEQWKASCVLHVCTGDEKSCHKLPIREPGGALSRAGVHAAASRFNQVDAPSEAKASAARQLRGAYRQLGEEVPDVLKASAHTLGFGQSLLSGLGATPNIVAVRHGLQVTRAYAGQDSAEMVEVSSSFGAVARFVWELLHPGLPGEAMSEMAPPVVIHPPVAGRIDVSGPDEARAEVWRVLRGLTFDGVAIEHLLSSAPWLAGPAGSDPGPRVAMSLPTLPVGSAPGSSDSHSLAVLDAALRHAASFGRGPGWVTHPADTRRLHDYWTAPGHEGYAKINWGVPGDFNRCRLEVGQEIGEGSPETLRFLNQICAQWHHDATGFWPGRAPTEQVASISSNPVLSQLRPVSLSLVASGAKEAPASWFDDPKLSGPTHLTVTRDGRVFGHIAEWKTCHIGYEGVCVAPPSSATDYAYFATGQVLLDNGQSARTGVISLGGGHAGPGLRFRAASAHYDSTSAAVADVSVGEDEYGIWCAGWVRPGVTEEQVVALRASDISGDWRDINGKSEMIAALAVNVAGFPTVSVQDRVQVSLVAAGVIQLREDDINQVIQRAAAYAVEAHFARRDRMAKLITRVHERI